MIQLTKILALTLILSLVSSQSSSIGVCKNYDSTTQAALTMSLSGTSVVWTFSDCPSGKVPTSGTATSMTMPLVVAVCTDPIETGKACSNDYPEACKTGVCNTKVCSEPASAGSCTSDSDTIDGYYCKNKAVTKSLNIGDACVGTSNFECYKGACNLKTFKCDTYSNALAALSFPALIGGDSNGFKTCTTSSVGADCLYNVGGTTKKSTDIGFGCIPTIFSATTEYYCQLGGGEQIFSDGAKWADTYYNRKKVMIFVPLIGAGSNVMKNPVSCAKGVNDLPWFLTPNGWKYTSASSFASPLMTSFSLLLGIICLIIFI